MVTKIQYKYKCTLDGLVSQNRCFLSKKQTKNKYIYIYIYIYIVEEGLDGHGLLLLRVSLHQLSDDRITRETLSNNNPCPSSPSSTILRSAYMALNTLQQDWLL